MPSTRPAPGPRTASPHLWSLRPPPRCRGMRVAVTVAAELCPATRPLGPATRHGLRAGPTPCLWATVAHGATTGPATSPTQALPLSTPWRVVCAAVGASGCPRPRVEGMVVVLHRDPHEGEAVDAWAHNVLRVRPLRHPRPPVELPRVREVVQEEVVRDVGDMALAKNAEEAKRRGGHRRLAAVAVDLVPCQCGGRRRHLTLRRGTGRTNEGKRGEGHARAIAATAVVLGVDVVCRKGSRGIVGDSRS